MGKSITEPPRRKGKTNLVAWCKHEINNEDPNIDYIIKKTFSVPHLVATLFKYVNLITVY